MSVEWSRPTSGALASLHKHKNMNAVHLGSDKIRFRLAEQKVEMPINLAIEHHTLPYRINWPGSEYKL